MLVGNGNVFYSPLSISLALCMTLMGSRGKTANELQLLMGLPAGSDATLADSAKLLIETVKAFGKKNVTLGIANALFAHVDFKVFLL